MNEATTMRKILENHPNVRDLKGQTFGRLTVLRRVKDHVTSGGKHMVRWLCRCECGNICHVLSSNLKSGITKSCGCLHRELKSIRFKAMRATNPYDDITGKTYGSLEVLSVSEPYIDPSTGYKHYQWMCRCSKCGRECVYRGDLLRSCSVKCPCMHLKRGRKKKTSDNPSLE